MSSGVQQSGVVLARHLPAQSVVEMAVVVALLIPIFIGFVDLGRAYFAYDVLVHAVNEGVRVGTYDTNSTNVVGTVISAGDSIGLASENVTVTCYAGSSTTTKTCSTMVSGDSVKVDASVVFSPITPWLSALLPGGTLTIAGTAQRSFQ